MSVAIQQAQEFRESPIGSRITNHVRTMVRNSISSLTTQEYLIARINIAEGMGMKYEPDVRDNVEELISGMIRLGIGNTEVLRFVQNYCRELEGNP